MVGCPFSRNIKNSYSVWNDEKVLEKDRGDGSQQCKCT